MVAFGAENQEGSKPETELNARTTRWMSVAGEAQAEQAGETSVAKRWRRTAAAVAAAVMGGACVG